VVAFTADLSTAMFMFMSMIYAVLSPSARAMNFVADLATTTISMIHVSL
jgi:hypothetical protein